MKIKRQWGGEECEHREEETLIEKNKGNKAEEDYSNLGIKNNYRIK